MKTNRKQDPQAAKNEAIYNLIADNARRAFELLTIEPGTHTAADVAKAIKKHRAFFSEEFYKLPEFVEIEHDGFTCSFRLADVFVILSKCATAWRIRTAARVAFVREEKEEQPATVAAAVADTLTTDTTTATTSGPATAPAAVAGLENKIIICSIPRPANVSNDDTSDNTTGDHLTPDEIRALVTAERERLADTINTDTDPDAPAFAVGESFELLTDTGATVAARVRSQYYNDDDTAAPCWLYLCDCDQWTDRHGVTIDGGTYDAARMRKTAAPAADGHQDTTDDTTGESSEPATAPAAVAWLRPLLQYAAAAIIGIFAALLLLITPERAQQATATTSEPATVATNDTTATTSEPANVATDDTTATTSEPATVAAAVADTLTTDTTTATTSEPATVAATVADTLTTDTATATTSEPANVANDDTTGESSEPATVANDDDSDDDTTTATDDTSDDSDDDGATSGPTTTNGTTTTTATTPGQPTPATTSGPATAAAAAGL